MTKFRRIASRPGFEEYPWFLEGYEFEGTAYPEYNQVEETTENGFIRIHLLDMVEEVTNDQ